MEEKQTAGAHRVTVTGRRNGAITGVSDVLSFDVGEIVLETELGLLTIKGTGTPCEQADSGTRGGRH